MKIREALTELHELLPGYTCAVIPPVAYVNGDGTNRLQSWAIQAPNGVRTYEGKTLAEAMARVRGELKNKTEMQDAESAGDELDAIRDEIEAEKELAW